MNGYLITLSSTHDWQQGLKVNQAVWELKSGQAIDWLLMAGYITQEGHGYGYDWFLTVKAIEWLKHNHIINFNYIAAQYNIFVRDIHPSQTMIRYFIEHFDNETDEWVEQKSFSYLVNWLGLTDGFDKTETAYVFNPLAIFEGNARKGVDYIIVGGGS